MTFEHQGTNYRLDGIAGLHVGDFLAAGEGVTCKEDLKENHRVDPASSRGRFSSLVIRYRFGTLDFAEKITFCGAEIFQSRDLGYISMDLEQYIHHVKPITVEKARRQTPDSERTPREVSSLRSLIGALQWPAAQCCPHLSATVSFLQAKMSKAVVMDLLEANRALRFIKNCADLKLQFESLPADFGDWRVGIYTDAS